VFQHVTLYVFIVQSSVLFLNMHVQSGTLVSPKKIISRYWACSKALFKVTVSSPVIQPGIK